MELVELYKDKIKDIRNLADVSGKYVVKNTLSDEKIAEQYHTYLNMTRLTENQLNKFMYSAINKLPLNLSKEQFVKELTNKVYAKLGWDKLTPINNTIFYNLGSVWFETRYFEEKFSHLIKTGTKGLLHVFENYDSDTIHFATNIKYHIESMYDVYILKNKSADKNIQSSFKDLNDLEENCSVKKMETEAPIFYKDKTKSLDLRLQVFDKYGKEHSYIYEPKNNILKEIFEIYHEQCENQRHENISCGDIIEWWFYQLQKNRLEIDYSSNKYHPNLKKTKRNYTPSVEAITRLKNYYNELLILEDVASFEFDW